MPNVCRAQCSFRASEYPPYADWKNASGEF
jgi:hypothetical protein